MYAVQLSLLATAIHALRESVEHLLQEAVNSWQQQQQQQQGVAPAGKQQQQQPDAGAFIHTVKQQIVMKVCVVVRLAGLGIGS
jgi:hypothetical protein